MRLPPGVTARILPTRSSNFKTAVGKEWVFTSDEDVDLYRDSYSPFWHEDEEPIPSAAVAPDGVEQVQAIVKIANQIQDSTVDNFDRARISDTAVRLRFSAAAWCST